VINILVEAGADINATNIDGRTPLIFASYLSYNPEAIITTLLQLGADPKIKDNTGKTAIDYARNNEKLKNTEVLQKLEEVSKNNS
jgi:ankyrin repeat protein